MSQSNRISRRDLPFLQEFESLTLSFRFRYRPTEILDWFLSDVLTREYGLTHLNLTPVPDEHREEIRGLTDSYFQTLKICDPATDVLGIAQQYSECLSHRQAKGAFYTPPEISYMMAKMQFHDLNWHQYPVLTVADPAAGSGSMLLSVVAVMLEDHPDKTDRLSLTAFDKDRCACLCTAVQLLSVCFVHRLELGEIKVVWMNSLTGERYGMILHARHRKYGPPSYDDQTIADLPQRPAA